jgi:putative DNA primase/helicase
LRLSEILGRLDGVEEDHDGHLALCPAHRDRNHASLKLTLKADGMLLMVCRTGCAKAKILDEMRLRESDLYDVVNDMGASTISSAAPSAVGVAEIAGLRAAVDRWADALQDDSFTPLAAEALSYAARRFGLTPEQCADLRVGMSTQAQQSWPWLSRAFTRYPRLTVPLVGFDGIIRGLQGRDLSGKCPARWVSLTNVDGRTWAKYGVLSGGAGYDTILVTEGPGDGLTTVGVGYDALIIRGAGLARNPVLVAELVEHLRGRDVVLAFDPDDAGGRGIGPLAEALIADGSAPRQLPFPNLKEDLTAWRERTPEEFPAELHRAVRAAKVVEVKEPGLAPAPSTEPDLSATDAALQTMGASSREAFDLTDVGIAVRLRDYMIRTGGGVRHAPGLGFLVWDGKVWSPGNTVVSSALLQMGAELIASEDNGARKIALKALTNRAIEDVIKILPSVPGVPVSAADFDADPELLSVANGTVNLRTGELRPHSPEDMITRRLDIDYRRGGGDEVGGLPDGDLPEPPGAPRLHATARRVRHHGVDVRAVLLLHARPGGEREERVPRRTDPRLPRRHEVHGVQHVRAAHGRRPGVTRTRVPPRGEVGDGVGDGEVQPSRGGARQAADGWRPGDGPVPEPEPVHLRPVVPPHGRGQLQASDPESGSGHLATGQIGAL